MTDASVATIVGVATGTADGGVAIVRVSGPEALEIVSRLTASLPAPRVLARRSLDLGDEGREDALVVVMPGPRSYTGEDVVELHIHGGERNVRSVVGSLVGAGAVGAGPGDFTRRAFTHGRLSLDQAEGIAAVIGARTDAALDQARRLVAGELGRTVEARREAVVALLVEVEANLDFPEDVDPGDFARWRDQCSRHAGAVRGWLRGFEVARRARERARIVLAGPANAGKSALFNALLERSRAVVSDQAGTTRDYVDAELALGRHAATLVDTAGLRTSDDAVERAGVAMGREQMAGADVIVWVEGADAEPAGETPQGSAGVTVIMVENKRDLGIRRPDWIGASATTDAGVTEVRQRLQAWFEAHDDPAWIGLARHRDRAGDALAALTEAVVELGGDDPALELAAFQLRVAAGRLSEITGRTDLGPVGAEVLDRIFAAFCIGK